MTYMPNLKKKPISITFIEISADYVHASGDVVAWDTLTSTSSSPRSSLASNVVTLTPGDYVINGNLAIERNSTTDYYSVNFYDNSDNSLLVEADGFFDAITWDANDTGSLVFQAQVSLSASLSFYMKSAIAAGDVLADGSSMTIMEL
jgi:type 1 fimbria pilin